MHACSTAYATDFELVVPENEGAVIVLKTHSQQEDVNPKEVLQVFVGKSGACCEGKTPIAGRYAVSDRRITFTPAFGFVSEQDYTVAVGLNPVGDSSAGYLKEFKIGNTKDTAPPVITAIYPGGNRIPENTLRFYIHFSTPMKPHVSEQYISLVDANGIPDKEAFMEFKQELWSHDRKRLTLLMDPGRIKRGVGGNQSKGPALDMGKHYSLVVNEGWPSANGLTKMPRFEKRFSVSAPLRTLPDPDLWVIGAPEIDSKDPLIISFDRAFDREQLLSKISVLEGDEQPVSGTLTLLDAESTWRFEPDSVWTESQLKISVDTRLEDVAGNNFIDLLDHAVGTKQFIREQITIDVQPTSRRD